MLTDQDLRTILNQLYRTQAFDLRAKLMQRTGLLGTFPSSRGQEHFFLACSWFLKKSDWYCPYYRDSAALFHRGMSALQLFQYWGGDERGNTPPPCTLPICVPIGSQVSHATGIAWSLKDSENICLVTLGDGASSKGDVYEAINFATVHDLPIIFAVNNNRYAISTPLSMQTKVTDMATKFSGLGLKTVSVDGFNIPELWQTFANLTDTVRSTRQPALINVNTYRLDDHTTADDSLRYRSQDEINAFEEKCPIRQLEQSLTHLISEQEQQQLKTQAQQEMSNIADQFTQLPPQSPMSISTHTYADANLVDIEPVKQRIFHHDNNSC